tara:strand:+ start:1460 stop:2023 length:564 start_codon:yes stop_codon:yes gene_type:complete
MSVIATIENGISLATKDYIRIVNFGNKKFDVKPKEDQIKCCLYKAFCDAGYLVHVEASYARNGGRCDLIAYNHASDSVALEIKTAWGGTGWNNKVSEQVSSWKSDLKKLQTLMAAEPVTHRYLLVCFCYQKGTQPEEALKAELDKLEAKAYEPFVFSEWNGLTEIQFYLIDSLVTTTEELCQKKAGG